MSGPTVTVLKGIGAAFVQFVTANLTTLAVSFAVTMEPEADPVRFVAVAGCAFTVGIVLGGLVMLRLGWLPGRPDYIARIVVCLVSVFTVLSVALVLRQIVVASPFLTGAMIAGIVGFHAPGWVRRDRG